MESAIAQLEVLANEWVDNDYVPEVDLSRMRSIDVQELLNKRNTCLRRREGLGCLLCNEFESHVCPATLLKFIRVKHIYIYSTKRCISSVSCETALQISN